MKAFKHKCELRLLVCEPNPLRPDRVTVGFVLRDINGDAPRVEVRLASNLRAIQCVYPEADLEAIEGTLLDMEPILKNVTDFEQYLQNMPADCPVDFSLLPETALLTDSIEDELSLLVKQYLSRGKRVAAAPGAEVGTHENDLEEEADNTNDDEGGDRHQQSHVGRMYIRRRMQEAFRHYGLLNFLQREIPVGKYTFAKDALKIDFGYRRAATNGYRMMHAVSVVTEQDRAATLAYKWSDIRKGLSVDGSSPELFAIVEHPRFHRSEQSQSAVAFMQSKGLIVRPVSSVMEIAAEAAAELRL